MDCPVPWVFDAYAASAVEPVVVNGDRVLLEVECPDCNLLFHANLVECPECMIW